ncbi:MAG: gephyrin-like molybdotransferase Glp [Streptosporangiaceae bacterium]|jgi:molybdopterin molybdotransferase
MIVSAPEGGGIPDATLTSVDAHLATIIDAVRPLLPAEYGLAEAEGCVLAEDVAAAVPLPYFDNAAMDGYAVVASDISSASERRPVTLPVTASIAAGDTGAYGLVEGSAIRITTGAQLPAGADAVVPVEWTDGDDFRVSIEQSAASGYAVRRAGEDAAAGEVLLTSGTRLRPMHIAVAASAGRSRLLVHPRPRVVVLATGDELAEPGTPLVPGRIWDSNSYMIAAAAREAGAMAFRHTIRDDVSGVLPALEEQLMRADVLVTTGGVSMGGKHDVVKEALRDLGTVTFRKVAMQPGMPQGFGVIGPDSVPIFTLPGNPVSAYVSFQLFVRPALGALQGTDLSLPVIRARLTTGVRSAPGKRSYLRAVLSSSSVTPLVGQGSHQVSSLGKANALVIVPEWVNGYAEGDEADVVVLP